MSTEIMVETALHIRWMIRRDMPEVMRIENESFPDPWPEDEFIRVLRIRENIGMVCEVNECVVGMMLYGLSRDRLHVLNFAVRPDCRRRGVGTVMVNKLKGKLHHERRSRITLEIRDSNLQAQLLFRSQGFRAVSVLREFYEDTGEDAYQFQFRIGDSECVGVSK